MVASLETLGPWAWTYAFFAGLSALAIAAALGVGGRRLWLLALIAAAGSYVALPFALVLVLVIVYAADGLFAAPVLELPSSIAGYD